MHLHACVSEQRGDGEGAGSQALSDTRRYINFAGLARGLVALRRALSKQSALSSLGGYDVLAVCDVLVICEACDFFGRRRSGRYVCTVIRSVRAGGGVFLAFLPGRPCGS
jgi:hypothetical protein